MIETVSGGCVHIEIDAEEGTTTAAAFKKAAKTAKKRRK